MLFNSHLFILYFLPAALGGYFLLGGAGRHAGALLWLLLASLVFYGWWEPRNLLVLLGSIAVNYMLGRRLAERGPIGEGRRDWLLVAGVAANLLLLGWFKYAGFAARNLQWLGLPVPVPEVILPLGISFFTFQQISYLVDSASGDGVRYRFTPYCLFVSFFPHGVAGPLVHHRWMMKQFENPRTYRPDERAIALGLAMFVLGLAKKVLLADSLAPQADRVFDAAAAGAAPTLIEAWVGALAYALQLYFDFSGYSDMAIGLALLFGIRLPINFNSPYQATSIADFWRRWHISLSAFLRDYLYIPLGGSRRGKARHYLNLFLTMLLGGIWHGAGWTFVIWGALHGLFLTVNHAWAEWRRRRGSAADHGPAFRLGARALTLACVLLGWVFFRAASVPAAASVLQGLAGVNGVRLTPGLAALAGWQGPTGSLDLITGYGPAALIPILGALVLAAPNTQQWLGYDPQHRHGTGTAGLPHFRPMHAAVLGALFAYTLTQMSAVQVFLYFQF
jgi:D-alanyl-lipoteichoic acid acyltransferase DltB (MBOAT superfamily)